MNREHIDYYQRAAQANLLSLILNSSFFCAVFAGICLLICFYLPANDLNVLPSASAAVSYVKEDEAPVLEEEEVVVQEVQDAQVVLASFSKDELSSSYSLKKTSVSNREDLGLFLYRQPETRAAVEGFYYQVTGSREIAIAILDAAEEYNVPLSLAFSVAYAESQFKPWASHVNQNGSVDRGLFQLNSNAFPNLTEAEFFSPGVSARQGLKHLGYFIKTAGNEVTALAMYNAGAGKVQNNKTPRSTLNYVAAVSSYRAVIEDNFAKDVLVFFRPEYPIAEKLPMEYAKS